MKVTVKDFIEYLQQFNPETEIGLDRDGWLEDEIKAETPTELIEKRGLFWINKEDSTYIVLNN